MNMNIGVIKGDGIGPEIEEEAMKVLDQVAKVYGHTISYTQLLMGGASIDELGDFSALAYFFGRRIRQWLNVPVHCIQILFVQKLYLYHQFHRYNLPLEHEDYLHTY